GPEEDLQPPAPLPCLRGGDMSEEGVGIGAVGVTLCDSPTARRQDRARPLGSLDPTSRRISLLSPDHRARGSAPGRSLEARRGTRVAAPRRALAPGCAPSPAGARAPARRAPSGR